MVDLEDMGLYSREFEQEELRNYLIEHPEEAKNLKDNKGKTKKKGGKN